MLRSQRRSRIRTRMIYTGEPFSVAGRNLAQISENDPPIPSATTEQAELETWLLERWGYLSYGAWRAPLTAERRQYSPFGFQYITPLRGELHVRLHEDLLAQFIQTVLPSIDPGPQGMPEVYGVAGLRTEVYDRYVLMFRPGLGGRIKIFVDRKVWNAAVALATEDEEPGMFPWREHPQDWTSSEVGFAERYGHLWNHGRGGNAFFSGLLRRCHVLKNKAPTRYWHLWMSHTLQLEWTGGPTHQMVMDLLMHPEFGLPVSSSSTSWKCRCLETNTGRDDLCYRMALEHKSGMRLDLRRFSS